MLSPSSSSRIPPNARINIDFRQLRLRWDNVTVVDAQVLGQTVLEILQLAPKLHHFKVNIKRSEDGSMPPHRVTHYSLLALEITGENDLTFLDHLVSPLLKNAPTISCLV